MPSPSPVVVTIQTLMPRGDFSRWLLGRGVSRPEHGDCPCCGVPDNVWCRPGCMLIDLTDTR